jgi:glycosyltransferase involved in cell wall biosynthesis
MPLHIGVNALFLIPGGVGGTEVYLRHLLAAIAALDSPHRFTVFLNQESAAGLAPAHPAFRSVQTGVRAASRPRRILYEQSALLPKLHGIDVLFNPGFTSPLLSPAPNVTVIHDLQHHRHPEFFKPADLLAWRFFVWASAKRSRRLLTVSEASRLDIHSVYGVPLSRIAAAEPGVSPDFFALSPAGAEPLVLCVSTLHPHKNIERLIDAFALFRRARPEYRLVLAGMRGFHTAAVERRIASHSLHDHVTITGWLPRHDVMALYARARIAVFPSTFEGYGMPVAEAMAAGVPLITSAIRPMMDIAGDTALLFPPHDTAALAEALERFAASPGLRSAHATRARQRAATFTWERAARITLQSLEAAAAHP